MAIFHTPPAFDALINGGPRRNVAKTFGVEKLEWCDYSDQIFYLSTVNEQ